MLSLHIVFSGAEKDGRRAGQCLRHSQRWRDGRGEEGEEIWSPTGRENKRGEGSLCHTSWRALQGEEKGKGGVVKDSEAYGGVGKGREGQREGKDGEVKGGQVRGRRVRERR